MAHQARSRVDERYPREPRAEQVENPSNVFHVTHGTQSGLDDARSLVEPVISLGNQVSSPGGRYVSRRPSVRPIKFSTRSLSLIFRVLYR